MSKSDFAIKLIKRGLTIPFADKLAVNRLCKKNILPRKSTRKNSKILRREIKSLLEQSVIEKAKPNVLLFENYIFAKPKPSGKIRVIFDMKVLNKFIKLPQLHMFTFSKAYRSLHSNFFACSIDLTNAFWHIGVHEAYRRYLAFNFDGVNYWWTAMPFGLRTAPYLFCKLMGTVVKHISTTYDILIYYYMDDLIVVAPTLEIAKVQIQTVIDEISKAGLTISYEKSELVPKSVIDFLGVEVNLIEKTFVPSIKNVTSCTSKALLFCDGSKKTLKNYQSLLGSLNFVAPYVKFGRLKLSPLHKFSTYFSNEFHKYVPDELVSSLEFWMNKSSYVPVPIPNLLRSEVKISCDASQEGWGVYITWPDDSHSSLQGLWDDSWISEHINIKELRAALLAVLSNTGKLENHLITFYSDNKATVT